MTTLRNARFGRALLARVSVLLGFLFAAGISAPMARGDAAEDPMAASAAEFCRLFMAGEDRQAHERMAAVMQEAVTPEVATQIRSGITGPRGPMKHLGEAWKEGEGDGYVRYRVPAEFEKGMLDFRVVFDGDEKVAGFFYVPHVDPRGDGGGSATAVASPRRPQEPKPPYPYAEEEVEFASGEIRLACTLTTPSGDGPFPAAMLISGSGAQDRNELVFGHKPFLVLADHLTRAGVAVLRCDDRGVGGSSGDVGSSTSDDFAGDALAGVRFLAGQPRIASKKIGLIGHSEGGLVAPLAASRSDEVAFVVMLAGSGVSGHEILAHQMKLMALAAGVDDKTVEAMLVEQRRLLDLILEGADEGKLVEPTRRLIEIQSSAGFAELTPEELDAAAAQHIAGMTSPWFRSFLAHDPRPALRRLKVPVLVLNGELDLQVGPGQNLPEIRKALEQGSNPDFTVKEMAGLNHLFQKASSGSLAEYATIEETVNPAVLETIAAWILERFGTP